VVPGGEETFRVDCGTLAKVLPAGANLERVIVEQFAVRHYSSSAAGALGLAVEGPLGEWVNAVACVGERNCMAVLMPFAEGPGVEGANTLGTPLKIEDHSAVVAKYRGFVHKLDGGDYSVDAGAPFAHRLVPGARVTEENMSQAMVEHETHDKVFNLSDGLAFALVPLEPGAMGGPVRLVFTLGVTLLPPPPDTLI
jgi:hypothetical protein